MVFVVWLFGMATRWYCNPRPASLLAAIFPEMVEALRELPARTFVLDGEIVIFENSGEKSGMDSGDSHSKKPRRARASYEILEDFSRIWILTRCFSAYTLPPAGLNGWLPKRRQPTWFSICC